MPCQATEMVVPVLPPEHYDVFAAQLDISSRQHSILKNNILAGGKRLTIEIVSVRRRQSRFSTPRRAFISLGPGNKRSHRLRARRLVSSRPAPRREKPKRMPGKSRREIFSFQRPLFSFVGKNLPILFRR